VSPGPILFGLVLVIITCFIIVLLTVPDGAGRCSAELMGLAGTLAVVLAVGLTENRTKHTGEKP
jgi:hypothetical protein